MLLCKRDRCAGVAGIARGKDADVHVQPFVAVDDVVAAVAHDHVAAVAAEDDVAGDEGGDARAEHGLQAR